MKTQLLIKRDGSIAWLGDLPMKLPGRKFTKRFSEITPVRIDLFILFRLLRFTFGERGKVAAWTRTWLCEWRMKILSTGYTEKSWSRRVLIEREHELFFYPLGDM